MRFRLAFDPPFPQEAQMSTIHARVLVLALVCLTTASCATHTAQEINEAYEAILEERHAQYVIKDGDMIEVSLYDPPSVEGGLALQTGLVLPDGRTDLFFTPNHPVAGKTLEQFEPEVVEGIKDEAGRDPEVRIQVTPRVEFIHMVGQWEKPGDVELTTRMTLRDAIAKAGGDSVTGRPWKVLLRRSYSNQLHPDLYYVDIWDESEQIFLLPGDIIENDYNIVAMVITVMREYIFGVIPSQIYSGAAAAAI